MPKPVFIVGPTAVGKTSLAVDLAERWDAEIVSADAFQVYESFDLLTAKPTRVERQRVTHHLVSCIPNSQAYDVAQYLHDAKVAIADIARRGKRVIVVGGNGLYVKALTHGLSPLPAAQPELRAEMACCSLQELSARLRALDPVTVSNIDAQNRRRVERALEVCLVTGKPFSSFRTEWNTELGAARPRGIFLSRDRHDLVARIDQRVEAMFAQGVIEEVRAATPDQLSVTAERIIGLTQIRDHLAGAGDLARCLDQIKVATRQYAKRQLTWFKREEGYHLINMTNSTEQQLRAESYQFWYDGAGCP